MSLVADIKDHEQGDDPLHVMVNVVRAFFEQCAARNDEGYSFVLGRNLKKACILVIA